MLQFLFGLSESITSITSHEFWGLLIRIEKLLKNKCGVNVKADPKMTIEWVTNGRVTHRVWIH